MTLALEISVGSSAQIALMVAPLLVLVSPWFGQPMSLYTWVGLLLCLVGVYLARGERIAAPEFGAERA